MHLDRYVEDVFEKDQSSFLKNKQFRVKKQVIAYRDIGKGRPVVHTWKKGMIVDIVAVEYTGRTTVSWQEYTLKLYEKKSDTHLSIVVDHYALTLVNFEWFDKERRKKSICLYNDFERYPFDMWGHRKENK